MFKDINILELLKITTQFLQPFSIDSADFPCRSPAISSPRSLYGQNICSVIEKKFLKWVSRPVAQANNHILISIDITIKTLQFVRIRQA